MSKKNDEDYEGNEEITRGPSSKHAEQKRKLEESMQGYELSSMPSDLLDCFSAMHIGEDEILETIVLDFKQIYLYHQNYKR